MGLFSFNFVKCALSCCVILLLHGNALSKNVPQNHRCSVGDKFEIKGDIACKPRPETVRIPKTKLHDVFTPTAVEVNRCSGGCSNMRNCTAKAIEKKCVLVEDKIKLAFEFREVEEHTQCSCCDLTADMCNDKQRFLEKECLCECKDELEAQKCSENKYKVWDVVNCNCICAKNPVCGTTTEKWSEETCRCEYNDKYQKLYSTLRRRDLDNDRGF